MKLYEKPALDTAILNNADIVTLSSGGLTSKFTKITGDSSSSSNTNSVQLD